ncbi:MAG: OmpA family protein [Bacteroidetes bacterium]|jgi:outer membrane protein OmpA-like peptidoglycan-associated protein|nr:OmpA family protein [Bacteroidota bacterium]
MINDTAKLLLLGLFFLSDIAFAQDKTDPDILELIEKGDKAYSRKNFAKAMDFYKLAGKETGTDPAVEKRIGVTLFKMGKYSNAVPVLKSVRTMSDTTDIYVDYYLAVSLHKLEQYDEAISMYKSCLDYIHAKSIDTGKEEIKKGIAQCKFWKEISNSPLDVTITRLDTSINTEKPEYGAKIIGDSLMFFTSRRMDVFPIPDLILKPDEDIYISHRGTNNKWMPAEKAGGKVNTGMNNAVLDISADGKQVFLYNDINAGDILVSGFNGKFSLPDTLKGVLNTEAFTESAFTVNRAADRCYFVSNRTDMANLGGKDIFVADRNAKGSWENVRNLGPTINSQFNEGFVFWSDEDTALYFSSNREKSVGGYDIFVCKTSPDGELLPAKNIGLPINTPFDDISFFKVGNKAWYSTTYRDNKEDVFEIRFNYEVYNPQWDTTSLEGITRIDEFNVIENIYFKTGSNSINTRDSAFLNLVDVLKKTHGAKLRLSGHSDWIGNKKINDRLSFDRAVNLAKKLVENGVDPKILTLDFFGESNLQTDTSFVNDSLKVVALSKNRYVDITVEKQGTPYIYVDKPEGLKNNSCNEKYGVMVYISDKPYKSLSNEDGIIESYSQKDNRYYYHSELSADILETGSKLDLLQKIHKDVYIFTRSCPKGF